jgi:hypothetical protein
MRPADADETTQHPRDDGYSLAFDEGVRGLARQEAQLDAMLIISLYLEGGDPWDLPAIHRELALHMDQAYELNRTRLDHLIWAFRAASLLLVLEVGMWVVKLVVVT